MKRIISHIFFLLFLIPLAYGASTDPDYLNPIPHRICSSLTFFVTFDPKPEKREEFLQLVLSVQEQSLKEYDWCKGFRIFSLPDNKIYLVEDWLSEDAFKKHINQPYIQAALKKLPDLLVTDRTKFMAHEILIDNVGSKIESA